MFLRELRKARGITMKELGDMLGVSESTISLYENGKREPSYELLLKIAEFFNVSVDYLLRGEDKKPVAPKDNERDALVNKMSDLGNRTIFAKNLRHYMELHGKTQTDLCRDLGFKISTFSDWVNANSYPRIDKIEMIANYFGIQKSDLIEEHPLSNDTIIIQDDPFANQLFAAYGEVKKEFTQDDIDDIKMFMEMVAERKRKKKEKEQGEK